MSTENAKKGIDLFDMTAKITLDADDCIAKLEHIKSLLQKIIELQKVAFGNTVENAETKIKNVLIEQLDIIKEASAIGSIEELPALSNALCEIVDRLKEF